MTNYIKNFVTGYGVTFDKYLKNCDNFDKADQKWKEIYSNLNINGDSVIIFCGAKNNGKSSLARFVINNYNKSLIENYGEENEQQLNNSSSTGSVEVVDLTSDQDSTSNNTIIISDEDEQQVSKRNELNFSDNYAYYVDFDPGQPEMTTPGCVSAHKIRSSRKPLVSPSYLNVLQNEPIILSSVGGTNMSVNPHMYIENCRFVFNKVKEHQRKQNVKRPIFINTMGHIRNVGLAMLMDLIKSCKPTNLIVLNIETDPMRTIYADLRPASVSATKAAFYYETSQQQNDLNYQCDIHNLQFTFRESTAIATKNRIALQLAYLATIPEALYKPIMLLDAKWISFKSISIYCVSSYPLKLEIVMELLYHSWVQLAKLNKLNINNSATKDYSTPVKRDDQQAKDDNNSREDNAICNVIDRVGQNQVFGCGIVADIDMDKKMIAIITPLCQNILNEQVNCIIKPLSIQVPREILETSNGVINKK